MIRPLAQLLHAKGHHRRLIYTGLTEAFVTYLKVSAFAASFIAFPLIGDASLAIYRPIFIFIVSGESLSDYGCDPLFLLGSLRLYHYFPAYTFFLSFETTASYLPIQLEAKVNEYLSLLCVLFLLLELVLNFR